MEPLVNRTFADRINDSQTRVVKIVLPHTTNHYNTLFGGIALQWMDEVAFITATRFSRQQYVTVSLDRIDFTKPIPAGTLVDLIGKVVRVGTTSVQVKVEVYLEQMFSESREVAINGVFTMVSIDENHKPTPIK